MIIHDASEPVSRARLVAFARRFRGACLRRFGARMPRSLRIRDVRWGGGPVSPASAVPQLRIPGYGRPGASASGRQRFKCSACGRRCNSLTGTVLEFGEKDLPVWVDFINLMRFGMPLKGIAANRGVSRPTAFEWRRLVFEAVDGHQDASARATASGLTRPTSTIQTFPWIRRGLQARPFEAKDLHRRGDRHP